MCEDTTSIEVDLEDIATWLTLGVNEQDLHLVYNPEYSNDWVRIAKAAAYNTGVLLANINTYIEDLEERLSKYEEVNKQ